MYFGRAAAIRGTAQRRFLGKDHLPPPEATAGHQSFFSCRALQGTNPQRPKDVQGRKEIALMLFVRD